MTWVEIGEIAVDGTDISTVMALICIALVGSHVRAGGTVNRLANVRRYRIWCSEEPTRTMVDVMMLLIVAILLSYISELNAQSRQ